MVDLGLSGAFPAPVPTVMHGCTVYIYIYPCVNKRQIDTEGVHVLLMAKDGPTILRAVGGATYLRAVDDGTN